LSLEWNRDGVMRSENGDNDGRALKNPFLCPDGRVARGEGRLAQ